jgi:hypothetical protein
MPLRSQTQRLSTELIEEETEPEEEQPFRSHPRALSITTLQMLQSSIAKNASIVITPVQDDKETDNTSKRSSWTDKIVDSDTMVTEDELPETIPGNSSTFWSNWLDNDEKEVRTEDL